MRKGTGWCNTDVLIVLTHLYGFGRALQLVVAIPQQMVAFNICGVVLEQGEWGEKHYTL